MAPKVEEMDYAEMMAENSARSCFCMSSLIFILIGSLIIASGQTEDVLYPIFGAADEGLHYIGRYCMSAGFMTIMLIFTGLFSGIRPGGPMSHRGCASCLFAWAFLLLTGAACTFIYVYEAFSKELEEYLADYPDGGLDFWDTQKSGGISLAVCGGFWMYCALTYMIHVICWNRGGEDSKYHHLYNPLSASVFVIGMFVGGLCLTLAGVGLYNEMRLKECIWSALITNCLENADSNYDLYDQWQTCFKVAGSGFLFSGFALMFDVCQFPLVVPKPGTVKVVVIEREAGGDREEKEQILTKDELQEVISTKANAQGQA